MNYKLSFVAILSILLVGCEEFAPDDKIKDDEPVTENKIASFITESVVNQILNIVIEKYSSDSEEDSEKERLKCELIQVIDGNTAIFKTFDNKETVTVGLHLIDMPKLKNDNSKAERLAKEAKNLTENLLKNANEIQIEIDSANQTDERLLGYVIADDKFLQEELLKAGLAKITASVPDNPYLNDFKSAEEYAKKKKLGLWDG